MDWVYTPYVLPLFFSAAASGLLGIYLYQRRTTPGAVPFMLANFALAFWAICDAMEIGTATLAGKIFWNRLEYPAIVIVPVCWFAFALLYSGNLGWLRPKSLGLLLLIPALTVGLTFTNAAHGLMSYGYSLDASGPFLALRKSYGPWFWVHTTYSYTLLAAGAYFLLHAMQRTAHWATQQVIPILIAILLPWLGNGLYITHASPVPYLDLTPVAFSISAVILIWGVFRSWLFDLIPLARTAVVESMQDGVLVLDSGNRLIDLNPAAAQLLGVEPKMVIGEQIEYVFARYPLLAERGIDVREPQSELTIGEADTARHYELRASPVTLRNYRVRGRLLVMHDITHRKRIENELEKSHALLIATLEATADGILVTDLRGKPTRYNQRLADMWNLPAPWKTAADKELIFEFMADLVSNPAAFYQVNHRLAVQPDTESYDVVELKDGRVFERYSRPQRLGDKRSGRVWSFHDITEQRRAEEKLRFLSTHDIITGLYNRIFFEEEINRLEGSRQYPISIIMADVDGLKETNDVYGHGAGDALLRRAADVLRQSCRTEDMVARIGGDEFGIILPHSDASVAERAIRRIQALLATVKVNDVEIPVSLSLGAATAETGDSPRKILRDADQAMYEEKRVHRQRRQKAKSALQRPDG